MSKILFIQTAFIGDAILGTAAVGALHAKYGKVDVLVRKGNEIFYRSHPAVNEVLIWDKKNKWSSWWNLLKTVRSRKYEKTFLAQRFFTMGLFLLFSKSKSKVGYQSGWWSFGYDIRVHHRWGNGIHEVQRLMDLIGENSFVKPSLHFEKEHQVERPSESYITISPSSVWKTKQAPLAVWQQVLDLYPKAQVLVMGGPGDKNILQEMMMQLRHDHLHLSAGEYSLMQSAWIMKGAVRNFVNDSGPLHLCTATNSPVTAFFCSTVPAFGFGPLSDDSVVLENNEHLNCRPCGMHGHQQCPKGHFQCGNILVR
jgi:heptosyltransferase-2